MTASTPARDVRRTLRTAGAGLLVTLVVAAVYVASGPSRDAPQRPTESPASTASPAPTATVECREDPGELAAGLTGLACPTAILAVRLAVAPVRLPIERVVIQPGPFFCDVLWPGVQSVPGCPGGYAVQPGQFMHAWVGFIGSPKVAVVMLGLDLSEPVRATGAARPPWQATLVTVEAPPSGWVLP